MDEPSAEALIFNVIAYGALATVFLYAVFNIFKPVPKKSHLAIAPPWGTDEEFAFPPVSVATNSIHRRHRNRTYPVIDVPILAQTARKHMLFDRQENKVPALPAPKEKKQGMVKKDDAVPAHTDEVAFVQVETKAPIIPPARYQAPPSVPDELRYVRGTKGEVRVVDGVKWGWSEMGRDWVRGLETKDITTTPEVVNPTIFDAENAGEYRERMATAMHATVHDKNREAIDKLRAHVDGKGYPEVQVKTIFCHKQRAWVTEREDDPPPVEVVHPPEEHQVTAVPTIKPLVKPVSKEAVEKVNKVLNELGMPPIDVPAEEKAGMGMTSQQLRERLQAHLDTPKDYRKFASGS
jgi:hypothetical protein